MITITGYTDARTVAGTVIDMSQPMSMAVWYIAIMLQTSNMSHTVSYQTVSSNG